MTNKFDLIVVCNNDQSLALNLQASDMVRDEVVNLHVERNATSASVAYNRALDKTDGDIVIFAHQDVYFPPGWETRLQNAIGKVEKTDPNWALIGCIGMSNSAEHVGQVWSTSLGAVVGLNADTPEPVQSFDELVIVLRRASAVRFDPNLPEFHLYGTDIVQTALASGKGAFACQLPVVHNDGFHDRLRSDFARAYKFTRSKWQKVLPIRTTVLWVTQSGIALFIYRLKAKRSLAKRRSMALDTNTNPRIFSAQCGWEESKHHD